MTLKAAQFVNLLLTGVLTGNEFGSWAALHPALRELPQEAHVRSEQAVTRRYGKMMPALIRELWSLSFRSCPLSLISGRCLFSSTSRGCSATRRCSRQLWSATYPQIDVHS